MSLKLTIRKDLGTDYNERLPRLRQAARQALEHRRKLGLPTVYRNELCIKPSHFVHEYPDGRKLLVEHDVLTMEDKVIRSLK